MTLDCTHVRFVGRKKWDRQGNQGFSGVREGWGPPHHLNITCPTLPPKKIFKSYFYLLFFCMFCYKNIFLSLPKRSKMQVVSKLGCRIVFLKYLSMKWNSSVQSEDQSKFYFNLFMATLLQTSLQLLPLKKLCNTIHFIDNHYTLDRKRHV